MNPADQFKSRSTILETYSWVLALAWTIIIGGLLGAGIWQTRQIQRQMARNEALANYNKDLSLKLWGAAHGGVYVPVTEKTPTNPYLSHIPERDIKTPGGKALTLMNPAYILRQTMEEYTNLYGVRGHIKSLKHFRPETAPDEWEKSALKKFEGGVKEVTEFTGINGKPHFRFMSPLITKKTCLKCHGHQGYKVGDVRGGISVSVPMAPYIAYQRKQTTMYVISFSLLWLLGLGGIAIGTRRMRHRIKEREQAEVALRVSEERLAIAVEVSGAGVYDHNVPLGPETYHSERWANIIGYKPEELPPADDFMHWLSDIIHPDDYPRAEKVYADFIEGRIPKYQVEIRMKHKSGKWIFVQSLSKAVERDESGRAKRIVGVMLDITDQKLMQRQLIQSEKLASLGFLISGVAHEINNPNNFITFNIPILRDYLKELIPIVDDYARGRQDYKLFEMTYPEFRKDIFRLLDNMEHGSGRINSIVSGLREFTRKKDKIALDWVDIKPVIEKGVVIIRSKIAQMVKSFEVNVPEGLPRIHTDPETLEHVLVNLLINAAQAADKEDSWIRISVTLGDTWRDHLMIEVSDNGCGMDEETLAKIFDPFFTTRSPGGGTGLGLSLCYNLIEGLGGRIEVESAPGEGSTFRVILPHSDQGRMRR